VIVFYGNLAHERQAKLLCVIWSERSRFTKPRCIFYRAEKKVPLVARMRRPVRGKVRFGALVRLVRVRAIRLHRVVSGAAKAQAKPTRERVQAAVTEGLPGLRSTGGLPQHPGSNPVRRCQVSARQGSADPVMLT